MNTEENGINTALCHTSYILKVWILAQNKKVQFEHSKSQQLHFTEIFQEINKFGKQFWKNMQKLRTEKYSTRRKEKKRGEDDTEIYKIGRRK